MDGLYLVICGIICIIWCVLNIILFFKIWGMCDDVEDIVRILSSNKQKEVIPSSLLSPKPVSHKSSNTTKKFKSDSADINTLMEFNNECLALFKQSNSKEEFDSKVEKIINKYNQSGEFDFSIMKEGLWEQFTHL